MKVALATRNPGKLKELRELAGDSPWLELILAPDSFCPEETGSTFEENALIKARAAAQLTGLPALADDSGLVVEALGGRPGIHSSRYCAGTDADRRAKLLDELKDVPEGRRSAQFVCNMVVCEPSGGILYATDGIWRGRIGFLERGENGFGYDPVFYLVDQDQTAAELGSAEKNRLSHRGQAWRKVFSYLARQAGADLPR